MMKAVKSTIYILLILFFTNAYGSTKSNCILTLAIVDGYSSGRFLPDAIKSFAAKKGIEPRIVHVHSDGKPIDFMAPTFIKENFDIDIPYDGQLSKLVGFLANLNPQAVMAGSEGGVLLADQLSNALHPLVGVPTNGVLKARRDKYEMAEVLRKKGVPAVRQMLSNNYSEILKWVTENHFWPAVLKPTMSAGTDGVSICHNEAELRAGFAKIMKNKNEFGKENQAVLAQEYLDGIEYVVNTTSSDGYHVVSDIWQYNKKQVPGAGAIYEFDRLLPYEGKIQQQLVEYIYKVLDALEIKTGWGHAEVKLTSRGPVLIEIGARMMGSGQPRLVSEAIGESQIEQGVEAFLDKTSFQKRSQKYQIKFHAANVSVNALTDGTKMSYRIVPQLLLLKSYKRHSFFFDSGADVKKTVDMISAIGQIELLHESSKVLEDDIATIKKWEQEGLFISK